MAILELAKGVLVLSAGFGLLTLLHRDVGEAAEKLVHQFHLNPASHTPSVFIEAASRVTDARLWLLATGAMAYALLRLAEGLGLWFGKSWAKWLGVVTGGIYIPIEIYELLHKQTWPKATIFVVNLVVVAVLVRNLRRSRNTTGLLTMAEPGRIPD